jgi:uncharacterized membrane protein
METLTARPPLMPPPPAAKSNYRIDSIDLLRGMVMIIMALDHTRDFFHRDAFVNDPLNLQTTSPELFFTRWITHLCAPVFVFLSGASVYLQSLRKTRAELSAFLFKRGLWLIFVEIVIMSFAISFDPGFHAIFLQVIWSIGISMILLALAIRLPFRAILGVGLLIVFGHNLLDYWESGKESFPVWYSLLHKPNFIPLGNGRMLGILYPFLPWTGLMFLGYCFGRLYKNADERLRNRTIAYLGIFLLVFFAILRFTNSYGDPQPWVEQERGLYTFLSFMDVEKYPPSLLYICATIGPALLFLALVGRKRNAITRIITVYGRVPFFYYVLHFYLIHALSALFYLYRGHTWAEGASGLPGFPFRFVMPGEGYSLGATYLFWIGIVAILYPACKWFSDYKQRKKNWWLSYL